MISKIIFTVIFIVPLIGSLSVLFKGIINERVKLRRDEKNSSKAKLIGFIFLSIVGLYIAIFLICWLWIPIVKLPFFVKLLSLILAAPYLLGVVGIGYGLQKATEVGGSPSKMANTVAEGIKEI